MSLAFAFSLLVTIFSFLVAVLYLYSKFRSAIKGQSSEENKLLLLEWLADHQVNLPNLEQFLKELNDQSKGIKSNHEQLNQQQNLLLHEWSQLTVEDLLEGTGLPQIDITKISFHGNDKLKCDVLIQWPDCVPGIEVSVQVEHEKVICHLQIDWVIMNGRLTLSGLSEKGAVMSFEQTMPPASALSCMVVSPAHWKAEIDIMKPLNDDDKTQASENLASSVTEGVIELLKQFKLIEYNLPHNDDHTINHEVQDDKDEDSNNETTNNDIVSKEEVEECTVTLVSITSHPSDIVPTSPETTPLTITTPPIDSSSPIDDVTVVKEFTEDEVTLVAPLTSIEAIPIAPPTSTEATPIAPPTSNGDVKPKHWIGDLPIITEPEEDYPLPSNDSSPSTWRRNSSYENLQSLAPPTSAPPTKSNLSTMSYWKGTHSDDDLLRSDGQVEQRLKRRSMTYSVRSYDTDSPSTPTGHLPSTLVYEVTEGHHVRHIVAITTVHSAKLRKLLSNYTKLHIYNDHTFTATHIKGKHICTVCQDKVTGLFGKQCYICRDCSLIVHKVCHFKTDTPCPKSKVSQLHLIYPDNISSISHM